MSTFDQRADSPYGMCKTCEKVIATSDESRAHMNETYANKGRSHTISILNPPREDRVRGYVSSHIDDAIHDAIDDALEGLAREVEGGDLTYEEVHQGLLWNGDAQDMWEEGYGELKEAA